VTYAITLAAATTLSRLNPQMTFIYVSGAGTDSSEHGRSMWARVKGKTENELQRLPFKGAYMFRPGAIQPCMAYDPRLPHIVCFTASPNLCCRHSAGHFLMQF
jgi:hypothetical protein